MSHPVEKAAKDLRAACATIVACPGHRGVGPPLEYNPQTLPPGHPATRRHQRSVQKNSRTQTHFDRLADPPHWDFRPVQVLSPTSLSWVHELVYSATNQHHKPGRPRC